MKKVMIIGAGPGGLTAGMLLARRGFDVSIYEKEPMVGGRNAFLELDGFKHDIGPTFLMMKFVLDEVFEEAGKKVDEYLEFTRLDPMYRLQFRDVTVEPSPDPDKMRRTIDRLFPGESAGYDAFMRGEGRRFDLMLPCLQKEYSGLSTFLHPDFLKALPRLSLGRSMYGQLGKYFRNERLKISFTFQSKYLGMSPWECPAAFTIIPYIEHAWGVYHTKGGLSAISQAMARAAAENGAKILTGMKAERVILNGKKAVGAEFADGRKEYADEVVLNADFGYAMTKLLPP
ncbi:MAG TPA: FAD-dependent oxidoreductase, partial [Elusimicrobiales bacterium]|nr:FAD-dependent oxidoreductase [Elusimicrobiales bacterium]